uniref:CCT-eta n=1 Tax=Dermatophagoides pteronyssinus TaxID=6956 RepID=A0A6P6Y796_DERPT|nr:T-complex protein 1 subunit eta-like [Dermatophagoides pteronyssinus]
MQAVNAPGLHRPIIILKAGTEASKGKQLVLSNFRACKMISDVVKSTLGPLGQDKLITVNKQTHITNDGATIMNLLMIEHPVAQILADVSQSQDAQMGDGTTSVVLLAAELLEQATCFVEAGAPAALICAGYRRACNLATAYLRRIAVDFSALNPAELRERVEKCAMTPLNSKLLATNRRFFARMVFDGVHQLLQHSDSFNHKLLSIVKVQGGSAEDSHWVQGVVFKKCFSYAGFENAPKQFKQGALVALLSFELELKAEKENAEIRINNMADYQKVIEAEWQNLIDKLDALVNAQVNVVLSRQCIGDIATQYLADRGVFCAGRVEADDLLRVSLATGGTVLNTVHDLRSEALGRARSFEEVQIGKHRYNVLTAEKPSPVSTIVVRGGAKHYLDEAERSLHDSIMICGRTLQSKLIVAGGGAVEMELYAYLQKAALKEHYRLQPFIQAFARALEVIPLTLAANSGLDSMRTLVQLRKLHHALAEEHRWKGVDCFESSGGPVTNMYEACVWEPYEVKNHMLNVALDAASLIINIDEMITNPSSNPAPNN